MNPTPGTLRIEWRDLAWFFLLALVVLAAGMGLRDPWPADEPRFALAAKQMFESGDWLIPHRGSELYSDKPPLFMALEAAGYALTGSWRVAFLLPSLLAGLGMLALVYDLARRLWGHRVGMYAAAALLCTFQFVYQAKRAQIDPTVSCFLTLANYGLLRHFLLGPDWRAYWLGCFAAGLGLITKGVGILAFAMFVPYLYARWRGWNELSTIRADAWRWLAGGVAFALATALWLLPLLLAVWADGGPEYRAYLQDILVHQTAGRYTDSWDHHQPLWFYLGVIALAWLPLSLAGFGLVPAWRERLRARDARFLLPLAWTVLIVIFFTFPKGKRDVYILPALPLVALAAAPFLEELLRRTWARVTAFALIVALGVGALATGLVAWLLRPTAAIELAAQRELVDGGRTLWLVLIALGVAALLPAAFFRVRRGVHALAGGLALVWLVWSFGAYPVLNDSTSAAGLMRHVATIIGPDGELGLVAWKEQNLLHAGRPVREFGFGTRWPVQLAAGAAWLREAPQRRWLFVFEDALGECVDRRRAVPVGHANRRSWWLVRADVLIPGCDPAAAANSGTTDQND